jgi:hypothetical protein
VTSTYSPGDTPWSRSAADRSCATGANRSVTSAIASPTSSTRPATDSLRRFVTAVSVEHSSRSLAWSVSTRFSSSGIDRSNDRMPASTCATGTSL